MSSKEYMRKWRKNHPHYSRDWQRKVRSGLGWDGQFHKNIFGIKVGFDYFATLNFVSKERAEREFLKLTD